MLQTGSKAYGAFSFLNVCALNAFSAPCLVFPEPDSTTLLVGGTQRAMFWDLLVRKRIAVAPQLSEGKCIPSSYE